MPVVADEAQFAKLVHEMADSGSSGADHLRQRFLTDVRIYLLRATFLSEMREQQEQPPLFLSDIQGWTGRYQRQAALQAGRWSLEHSEASAGRMGCRISMRCAARRRYAAHLIGVRDAAVIFPPGILLCVAEDIRPRDVMMDADLSASEPGEVFLSHVSASAIEAVCLLMIDSLDLETLMTVVARLRFVGVDDRALDDLGADE